MPVEAAQVGLKNLYYALLLTDDAGGVTYDTPVAVAPVIDAKITPKSSTSVLYADDGAADSATAVGEVDVELETKNIPLDIQATWLGHTLSGGVLVRKSTDQAPYVAIGFESVKSNGASRFVWIYKMKFEVPSDEYKTKADKVDFQTAKIKGTGIKRIYDNAYNKMADSENASYVASVGTNWFLAVDGAPDTTAPTVSTVPADAATGVSVNTTVAWTFDEAINASQVSGANFIVMKSDGTAVAGALTINAGHTVVTFTPTSALSATTDYLAIATTAITDLAGNHLAAISVSNFTTA